MQNMLSTEDKQEPHRARPRVFVEPEEDYELPDWRLRVNEMPREAGLDPDLVDSLIGDAHLLRVDARRLLWEGQGDETQPDLVRMRRAVEALGHAWGHAAEPAAHPASASTPATTVSTPEASPALKAAQALAAVMEEGDADGRLAVLARIEAIRAELGYDGVGQAARAVVDQFALATVHLEAVRACAKSVRPAPPVEDGHVANLVGSATAPTHGPEQHSRGHHRLA